MPIRVNEIKRVLFTAEERDVIPKILTCAKEMFPDAEVSILVHGVERSGVILRGYINIVHTGNPIWGIEFTVRLHFPWDKEDPHLIIENSSELIPRAYRRIDNSDDLRNFVMKTVEEIERLVNEEWLHCTK